MYAVSLISFKKEEMLFSLIEEIQHTNTFVSGDMKLIADRITNRLVVELTFVVTGSHSCTKLSSQLKATTSWSVQAVITIKSVAY
jgi:hypothetical protein